MEEPQKPQYILSQAEKEEIDNLLQVLRGPLSDDERNKQRAAKKFGFQLFRPWKDAKTKSVREYFKEKNGPQILIEAFLATKDERLQRFLAISLWMYGETVEHKKEIIQAGALPVMVSLARDPEGDASDVAFGWLWGVLEIEELLDYFAQEGVPQILAEKVLERPIESLLEIRTRILGCMQCAAVNKNCRKQMLPALDRFLSMHESMQYDPAQLSNSVLLGLMHSAVFIAYMAIDEIACRERINSVLENFMEHITVQSVAEVEENEGYHGNLWHNILPFLPLIETDSVVVRRFGTFVLAKMSKSDQTRDLMTQQNLVPRLQMLSYSQDERTKYYAIWALSNFKTKISVPSLKTWCYWHLMLTRGVDACKRIVTEYNINY